MCIISVSYTHLDVYKRQLLIFSFFSSDFRFFSLISLLFFIRSFPPTILILYFLLRYHHPLIFTSSSLLNYILPSPLLFCFIFSCSFVIIFYFTLFPYLRVTLPPFFILYVSCPYPLLQHYCLLLSMSEILCMRHINY